MPAVFTASETGGSLKVTVSFAVSTPFGGDGEVNHCVVAGVGDIEIRVVGRNGHGDRVDAAGGNRGSAFAQCARLRVRRVGVDLPVGTVALGGGTGHEYIVNGDELAGSQKGGH